MRARIVVGNAFAWFLALSPLQLLAWSTCAAVVSMRLEYSSCHGQVSGDVVVVHATGLAD